MILTWSSVCKLLLVAVTSWVVQGMRSSRLIDIVNQKDDYFLRETYVDHDYIDEEIYQDVKEETIRQILDHFRLEDERTFHQRYFYTDRYVNPAAAREYAFLCVGGEGPALTKAVLVDSVHCTGDMIETARRLYEKGNVSIHLYALEHRYYGKSYPTFHSVNEDSASSSPVTNKHLVYLSSRQAQADLAHFIATQNTLLGSDGNIPWITFGGSYPGVMAAYARLRFPHYVAAAVSSSAPIQALLDFAGYKNHVAKALNDTKIGGSPACLQVFVDGHAELIQQVKDPSKHAEIAKNFGLCNASQLSDNPRNVELFLGDGVIPVGTQENDPSCTEPLCNIAQKCAKLLEYRDKGDSPAQALAHFERDRKMAIEEASCNNISWEDSISFLSNSTWREGGWRSWLWQTCTEFGFYQTCEVDSACPFGRGFHPLSQDLEICQRAFGVRPTSVARAVQESNQYYGGWHLGTTRVLSVNGDVDPWSELALLHTFHDELPAFVVRGASHHFWTHAVQDTDSAEVIGARELIFATVEHWLDEIDEEFDRRPIIPEISDS